MGGGSIVTIEKQSIFMGISGVWNKFQALNEYNINKTVM